MTQSIFDSAEISIPCPHCQAQQKHKIGRVRSDASLRCGSCSASFRIDAAEFYQALRMAERDLENLAKALTKSGKGEL